MKKFMLFMTLILASLVAQADIGDQINASLIDHISAHTQYTTKGENRLSLLSSVVEIGNLDGNSVGQLRFGFTGVANPQGGVSKGAGYVGDIYINVSPFIRRYVKLANEWQFLNSIEAGPNYAYDFREHHSYLAFSIGLAFGLNPK